MRIVTLNTYGLKQSPKKRFKRILNLIDELSPDVIGFQEVHKKENELGLLETICELGYESIFFPCIKTEDGYQYGNAILFKKLLFKLEDSKKFELELGSDSESRCLGFVLLNYGSKKIPLFCTHLSHESEQTRKMQSNNIYDILSGLFTNLANSLPPIIFGDFNASPETPEIQYLLKEKNKLKLRDCWSLYNKEKGFTVYFDNPLVKGRHKHNARIDYIFFSGTSCTKTKQKWELESCNLIANKPIHEGWCSDHFGLVSDFRLII